MLKSVFEGREDVKSTYDEILIYLKSILDKDDSDDLEVELNTIEDLLIENSDNEDYTIFKINVFKLFDKILIKYGIILREEKSFEIYFNLFYLLYNIKYLDFYREEVELITHGDYNIEDKLHLLFSLYFEETIVLSETVETSERFFSFIEENIKEEKVYNIDLIQRAVLMSQHDESFKDTVLFKSVLTGETIYKLSLHVDLEIIKNELTERVYNNIIGKFDYKDELIKVSNEVVFTLLFYHYDVAYDLTKILDRDYILSLFNKPILEIDTLIENINKRLIQLLKGENNE